MRAQRWLAAALAAVVLVAGALLALATLRPAQESDAFQATDVTGVPWGRDFHLLGHDGKQYELGDFRGKVVSLYFGYTRCPDVCPTTMATLGQAVRLLGEDGARVQGLFVTVDPRHDKPAALARYVASFHASFIGLYGDTRAIKRTAREFRIEAGREHSTPVFVFDGAGRLRLVLRPEATAESVAHDLRLLLAEAADRR